MKKVKLSSIVMLFAVPVMLFACATAKSQYENARKINTISAYQEFLSKHPSGEYAELAQTRIEALNFEKAKAVNTVDAYERFMGSSHSDLFKNYAIQSIQMIYRDEYLKAKEIDTVEAFDDYMTTYPKSNYLPDCMARIEYLEWNKALKRHDAVGFYKYLNNCSACGKHNQEALRQFARTVRSGAVVDLSAVKARIEQILNRSDIVVTQFGANKISAKAGSMRFADLASAKEVLVSLYKEGKPLNAVDLAKGNYASEKAMRLKNRVPVSENNIIGFSTIIFYPEKKGDTLIVFIEDDKGYLFRETDTDIY